MKTPQERIEFFETVERGFALQARITTLLTGLSGLYLYREMDMRFWLEQAEAELGA